MIAVIGAGSFGTAIAHCLARNGHEVTLVTRNASRAAAINELGNIPDYPAVMRPQNLKATVNVQEIKHSDRIVMAIPTQQLRSFLKDHQDVFDHLPVLLLQKGIEKGTGLLPFQIASSFLTGPISILSGPNFADEILMAMPTATTISAAEEATALEWAVLFKSSSFRPYVHRDIIGAQVGGAIKNVIAVACGVVNGLDLGQNATAAIITRGLAEMCRLGKALGAQTDTFLGLSCIGDLTLTCNSQKSRNFRFGRVLAKGEPWDEATQGTVEGYHTAFSIELLMHTYGVSMPICETVRELIDGKLGVNDAVQKLMNRDLKQEVF
jgi:glycerol-3-phosphate dehydrogenase (NAD(P)+)